MKPKHHISKAAFLTEGGIVSHPIGYPSVQRAAPPGESAVASLAAGSASRVFGLTYGNRSHLFFYDSWSIDNFAFLVQPVAEDTIGGELFCTSKGVCYGIATSRGSNGIRNTMFRYDSSSFFLGLEMWVEPGLFEGLDCPFAEHRTSAFALDPNTDTAYCILLDERVLVAYDTATGNLRQVAHIGGEKPPSPVLALDHRGRVYCAGDWGSLLRVDPETGGLETVGTLPAGKGKEYVNQASALTFDADSKTLYGGTLIDGYLFRLDVEQNTMTCIGKPTDQRHIRALAVIPDGRVYGLAGEPQTGVIHLFRYDPRSADLRDLGLVASALHETWVAHEIDAMAVNRDGHLVMGESDRLSHLFVYYPPIVAAHHESEES